MAAGTTWAIVICFLPSSPLYGQAPWSGQAAGGEGAPDLWDQPVSGDREEQGSWTLSPLLPHAGALPPAGRKGGRGRDPRGTLDQRKTETRSGPSKDRFQCSIANANAALSLSVGPKYRPNGPATTAWSTVTHARSQAGRSRHISREHGPRSRVSDSGFPGWKYQALVSKAGVSVVGVSLQVGLGGKWEGRPRPCMRRRLVLYLYPALTRNVRASPRGPLNYNSPSRHSPGFHVETTSALWKAWRSRGQSVNPVCLCCSATTVVCSHEMPVVPCLRTHVSPPGSWQILSEAKIASCWEPQSLIL